MDDLISDQTVIAEKIQILKRNYYKTPVDRRTRGYVTKRSENLESLFQSFQDNDIKLHRFAPFLKSNYATEKVFDQIDDLYTEFSAELADRIDALNAIAIGNAAGSSQIAQPQVQAAVVDPQVSSFRLPQISIPTFSGDYNSWSAFQDMFISLVHSNRNLTNVQKLHYLKCNLRGQAENLLRHTAITNDNYEVAWEALKQRYNNKRVLVDTQLKLLVNHPSHHAETVGNIRELIDTVQESLNALRGLEIDFSSWDPLLLFIVIQKLSKDTHKAWEINLQGSADLPKFAELIEFLENRFRMLEFLVDRKNATPSSISKPNLKSHTTTAGHSNSSCSVCNEHHYLRDCPQFLQMNNENRRCVVKQNRICFNCLVPGHLVTECKNRMNCKTCNKRHHSLLHQTDVGKICSATTSKHPIITQHINVEPQLQQSSKNEPSTSTGQTGTIRFDPCNSFVASSSCRPKNVLLSTAIVIAMSRSGHRHPLRALIDPGSDASFISENAAQLLRLKQTSIDDPITGIGNTFAGRVRTEIELHVLSQHEPKFSLRIYASKIQNITGILPHTRCDIGSWTHLSGLTLADPNFFRPGSIDLLLGSDVYTEIMLPGLIKGPPDTPMGQQTVFGWIINGKTEAFNRQPSQSQLRIHHTCININSRLKQFWEIEDMAIDIEHTQSDEEIQCEKHYASNFTTTPDGRYVVRLPLRGSAQIGESRTTATQRLLQLERRLSKDNHLKTSYINFMREYISLGHMQLSESPPPDEPYFIPHHAVLKENSSTTKVRVVFDASCKSNNGVSLNDCLMIGPKIQDDLSIILLRWRKFPFAFTGDVEKMYRQIRIHKSDQHLQHVLWRESSDLPIADYVLLTVTYGTSCAPHLAVRTLKQLAIDHELDFPIASKIAKEDFYVDDLMTGAYSIKDAMKTRREVSKLLSAGGFKLRKWVSNCSQLLDEIPLQDREIQQPLNIEINNTVTALGIIWNPAVDAFTFKLNLPRTPSSPTKRNILSDISKLFDPLGWLSPIIIRSKIMMQQLWLKGVEWDDVLPDQVAEHWKVLRTDLFKVEHVKINRWMYHHNNKIELHGFCDASSKAYAAVIYSRIRQPDGEYKTTLLTAKSRVAPLQQLSIPRLELCGAKLLADLLFKTQKTINVDDTTIFAWTDSSIVIHWLRAQPSKWKTFVANRVASIQHRIPISCWRHVPTVENPADCASRGIDTDSLQSSSLWWQGPAWLKDSPSEWPVLKPKSQPQENELEQRTTSLLSTTQITPQDTTELIERFSSLGRLLRVTAYCKRFAQKCRKASVQHEPLSAQELQTSLTFWISVSQKSVYTDEINRLSKKLPISAKSTLKSLNPFLDEHKIIRVGGRLQNTSLTFDEKHPIILNKHSHLTTLIIRTHHLETMHGGPQLVLGLLRKKYWVVDARNAVRVIIYRCIACHRFKATSANQLMGNLPEPRVRISRAFTHTGVDYAGPIDLRMSKGRGSKSYKGYISLFVCLSTKAIHIEAVSDLTSNSFIAAYRRFVARRGLPAHIYSDNGTNFVGAVKILRKAHESCLLKVKADIIDNATKSNTEWHFIPASSPHFGGLWEAGVKSLKHHLKRTIGNSKLTFEELYTLLAQIEACLNSRPLAPLTTDVADLTALTPGHFLIGDALLSAPDQSSLSENISLLSRWQLVQRLFQSLSRRWQTEYLSRLQQRPKWTKSKPNIQINDLVLIKDMNSSPNNWPLARVIEIHPGTDGLVRVVTVRTSNSTFKRSITKICPLPY